MAGLTLFKKVLRNGPIFCLIIYGCIFIPAGLAGVIVSTSLTLTQFTVASDDPNGVFQIVSPLTATAGADAQDSVNGDSGDSNQQVGDGAASASVSTGLAGASGAASSADYSNLTASAMSGVNLSGLFAFASTDSSSPFGSLGGFFRIADSRNNGSMNPVDVTFTALLNASQSLLTDAYGLTATSEVAFQLRVDGNLLLLYDHPLGISSASTLSQSGPQTLSVSTNSPLLAQPLGLVTNKPYSFYIQANASSSGLDSPTPEPAPFLLLGAALLVLTGLGASRFRWYVWRHDPIRH